VYNNGLHRLKLGPYDNKQEAEQVAANIRKRLNISTIITNQ
jgi:rare lipoprotein A